MNKTYALIRVSSDKQDFNSQMEGIRNYCKQNNIILQDTNIIQEYNISGYSTKLEDRKGLQQLIQLALNKEIDTLIVFNQDRIGRRLELLSFLSIMTENNVTIISVTEGILNDNSDTSDLLQAIKLWTASYESKKTSIRVKNGKLNATKNGKWNGGRVNLGYKVQDGKLMIDESIAPIIREIYNLYINGGTNCAINYLQTHNIRKSGSGLIQMLRNPIYKGYYNHINELYSDDDYKTINTFNKDLQIVSEDIWNKAIQVMENRRTNLKGNRCKALNRSQCEYEGLLYHECGNKLTIDYDNRGKTRRMLFKCRKCKNSDVGTTNIRKCFSANKLLPQIDEQIQSLFGELNRELLEEKYINKVNYKVRELEASKQRITSEIDTKRTIIQNTNKKLQQMLLLDVDVSTITVLTNTINNLESDIHCLENSLDEIHGELNKTSENVAERVKILDKFVEMKDIYDIANYKQKRQILQTIINKIVVTDYDDITIVTNLWP